MTTISRYLKVALVGALTFLTSVPFANSQSISITKPGVSYSQDFNALPRLLSTDNGTVTSKPWQNDITLPGWSATVNGISVSTIEISQGAISDKGLKSIGATATTTERSLGSYASSSEPVVYGVSFVNAIARPLTQIGIGFELQQWYAGPSESSLRVEYRITAKGAIAGAWVPLTSLVSPVSGNLSSIIDGNALANKTIVNLTLAGINLAPEAELAIRWIDDKTNGKDLLAIDNFQLSTALYEKIFYSSSTVGTDLSKLSAWNSDAAGKGTLPVSFTDPYQTFIVQAPLSGSHTLASHLVLSGSSKVVVGTGLPIQFTIPENVRLEAGVMDIAASATVTIASDVVPTLGLVNANSTVIYNSKNSQLIKLGSYGNLLIDGTGGNVKKLSQRVVVQGELELRNGARLEAGEFDVVLQDSKKAIKYDVNSFLVTNGKGRLKMKLAPGDSAVFPVGLVKALPVKLKLSAASLADTFSVKVMEGIYSAYNNNLPTGFLLDNKVVGKTWVVDEHTTGGSNLTMTLTWNAEDIALGFASDSAHLLHYYNQNWDKGAAGKVTLKNGLYSITRTGITSFSPFAVADPSANLTSPQPLPVELLYFQAKRVGQQVQFLWATASEKDNAFFILEHSLDGKNFLPVGQAIKGSGNSAVALSYSYLLDNADTQTSYFRLKQTDFDGGFEYSKVVAVNALKSKAPSLPAIAAFPNPSADGKIQLVTEKSLGLVTVTVLQGTGQVVFQQQAEWGQGKPLALDLSAQQSGVYFVQVQTGSSKEVIKVIKR
ncbi:T9SS type A sorting domain-containing protein [Rufibacter soli]